MSQLELDIKAAEEAGVYRVSARKKRSLAGKEMVSAVVLRFLFHGFRVLGRKDERIRLELESWEDGFTWGIGMGENAPALYMKKTERGLLRIPAGKTGPEQMDLMIAFKSVDAAFLVMTGQVGVAGSYARHGFTLKGDIARGMSIVRCMDLLEAYLFPRFITKHILKRVPKKRMGLLRTYLAVFCELLFHGEAAV